MAIQALIRHLSRDQVTNLLDGINGAKPVLEVVDYEGLLLVRSLPFEKRPTAQERQTVAGAVQSIVTEDNKLSQKALKAVDAESDE